MYTFILNTEIFRVKERKIYQLYTTQVPAMVRTELISDRSQELHLGLPCGYKFPRLWPSSILFSGQKTYWMWNSQNLATEPSLHVSH